MGKKSRKVGKTERVQEGNDALTLVDRRLPCGLNGANLVCAVLYKWPCGGSFYSLCRILGYGHLCCAASKRYILAYNVDERSTKFTILITVPWILLICLLWYSFGHILLTWAELGRLIVAGLGMRLAGPPLQSTDEFEDYLEEALDHTNGDVHANPELLSHGAAAALQELRWTMDNAARAKKQRDEANARRRAGRRPADVQVIRS